MESFSRVVGSPQANRLFGAKSREELTSKEKRRSGHWSPAPVEPEHTLPKVIYVPLPPPPPRLSQEDEWATRVGHLSETARKLCGLPPLNGLPPLSPESRVLVAPWPEPGPTPPTSDHSVQTDDSLQSLATPPPTEVVRRSLWRRLLAFFCLSRG